MVNWTLGNKLKWNLNKKFEQENAFENVVCEMVAILPWPQWVNSSEAEWRIYASVKLTIIGSDNGLSPVRRQAIIWTNAGILLIGPLGTNFIEILNEIHTFSFKKLHLKMSSAKWRPFRFGLNVLNTLHNLSVRQSHWQPLTTVKSLNIRRTKSQNLNDSHLVLKSSLPNPFKPGVKSIMKM